MDKSSRVNHKINFTYALANELDNARFLDNPTQTLHSRISQGYVLHLLKVYNNCLEKKQEVKLLHKGHFS